MKATKMKEGEDPNNPVRIYADGVFDFFHYGHARQLEQCKKLFKHVYLIVGVSGQEETEQKKGKTVMNESERVQSVQHCKWVDEVVCPCPWVVSEDFLKEHRIDYVAHDDIPYINADGTDGYGHLKAMGKFKVTKRTEGVSTSDLISRILKDRDDYSIRNLKRGLKGNEIGLNYFETLVLKAQYLIKNLMEKQLCKKRKQKSN